MQHQRRRLHKTSPVSFFVGRSQVLPGREKHVYDLARAVCDEAKPGQILISARVLMAVEDTVTVEPVGEFELKGIRRPIAAYNVLATAPPNA